MTASRHPDDIIREMREIRQDMHEDVVGIVDRAQGIVERAQDFTDWRYYVRNYPLTCLGAAVLAGYFLIPAKPRIVEKEVRIPAPETKAKKRANSTLFGTVGGLVASLALQAASAYAKQQLSGMLNASLNSAYPSAPPSPNGKHGSHAHSGPNGGDYQ
jgi:hypothetical protein